MQYSSSCDVTGLVSRICSYGIRWQGGLLPKVSTNALAAKKGHIDAFWVFKP